jgi:hypothetical protein
LHTHSRLMPTGLADGLGLGSVLWHDLPIRPSALGPPRAACGAALRLRAIIRVFYFARRRTSMRMGVPTNPNSSRSLLTRNR